MGYTLPDLRKSMVGLSNYTFDRHACKGRSSSRGTLGAGSSENAQRTGASSGGREHRALAQAPSCQEGRDTEQWRSCQGT